MKIIFAGTPEPAAVVLEYLLGVPEIDIAAVVTQPDARRGRGRTLHPSAVAAVAEAQGLPVFKWENLKAGTESGEAARAELQRLSDEGVTAAAVVAYGNLIPADLLDVFTHGWINLHFSLLPRWRGAAPVQAALAAGDDITGTTTFRIEAGMDTGPMIAAADYEITATDTADDLLTVLTHQGRNLLAETLLSLDAGTAELTPQDDSQATHAPKIVTADAEIDWSAPAAVINRRIRAHTPAPGAWTLLHQPATDGTGTPAEPARVKIGATAVADAAEVTAAATAAVPATGAPGTLTITSNGVWVTTGTTPLQLLRIQPPGKKMMDAAAWARGLQTTAGLTFQQKREK